MLHGFEEMANLAACATGTDIRQPAGVWVGMRCGNHLDLIAVLQLGTQGHQLVVDARSHTTVANVGVHHIGEIHRRRPARQLHDLALGREHIDLVGKKIDLHVLEEFG